MNKDRREKLNILKGKLEELKSELETLSEEETECRDNMPEAFGETDKYERADTSASALEDAVGMPGEAIEEIDNAVNA